MQEDAMVSELRRLLTKFPGLALRKDVSLIIGLAVIGIGIQLP